ncbi:MAG: glycine oxidase ThiO, partial [Alkalicoccus sp.]
LEGKKVLLLEKGEAGKEASHAAAGMLGAQTEMHESRKLFRFAVTCRDYFREFAEELEKASGQTIQYRQEGAWRLASGVEEEQRLKTLTALHHEEKEPAEYFSGEDVRKALPFLKKKEVSGAAFFKNETQVDARSYTAALIEAVQSLGGEIREQTEICDISRSSEKWQAASSVGNFYSEKILLAHGNGKIKGAVMPEMIPVKGECIALLPKEQPFSFTIVTPEVYLVPKADGRLIVGATETEGELSKTVRAGAVRYLLGCALDLVPELHDAPVDEIWAGIRPKSPDGVPFAGRLEEDLYVLAGHYRNGILMSGYSGRKTAEMMTGKNSEALQFLQPNRRETIEYSN